MSVPKSTVLSCSRGFLAKTGINLASPKQSQSVNVNVLTPCQSNPYLTECHYPDVSTDQTNTISRNISQNELNENNPPIQTRSIETAENTLNNLQSIIHDKDLLIQALVLCLDIYENNPLIINKYVVAQEQQLIKLIQLLTDSENVELLKYDETVGCLCKSEKYDYVSKIIVKKNNETLNLKYSFADVSEFLYEHKISTKLVC